MNTAERVDMKFEVVVIPVAEVDRSKEFYLKLALLAECGDRVGNCTTEEANTLTL